jgi:hypothetical protein
MGKNLLSTVEKIDKVKWYFKVEYDKKIEK